MNVRRGLTKSGVVVTAFLVVAASQVLFKTDFVASPANFLEFGQVRELPADLGLGAWSSVNAPLISWRLLEEFEISRIEVPEGAALSDSPVTPFRVSGRELHLRRVGPEDLQKPSPIPGKAYMKPIEVIGKCGDLLCPIWLVLFENSDGFPRTVILHTVGNDITLTEK